MSSMLGMHNSRPQLVRHMW